MSSVNYTFRSTSRTVTQSGAMTTSISNTSIPWSGRATKGSTGVTTMELRSEYRDLCCWSAVPPRLTFQAADLTFRSGQTSTASLPVAGQRAEKKPKKELPS
jgi:hypothetical protein